MNKDQTLSLIRQQFTNVTILDTDVVRAERCHKQVPVGIYYFDLSEALGKDGFNLTDYLQRHIATGFYKHEGSLQWNYYLYFVLDKKVFQKLSANGTVAKIEADRTFARKFVREETLFQQELVTPLTAAITHTTPAKDIASIWTLELNRAGLAGICNPKTPYTKIIDHVLSGQSSKGLEPALASLVSPNLSSIEPGRFVRYLHIEDFRRFPSVREFNFGTANLIRGVNGSGKTSLLEAIELSICGGIRRQGGEKPAGARLQIQFDGDNRKHQCPQNNLSEYRLRDLGWYGGYYRGGNQLCHNFGRFNFFDTDAAFRLSSADTGEDLQKAIHALFLGELTNTLEERMLACRERLQREEKDFNRTIQSTQADIRKLTAELKLLSDIKDTSESLFEELKTSAAERGWVKVPKQLNDQELIKLQNAVEDICSRLRDYHRQIRWMPRVTISLLEQEVTKLKVAGKDIESKITQADKINAEIAKRKERITDLNPKLQLLRNILKYHSEPEGFSLMGLEQSIAASKTRFEALQEATRLMRGIDTTPFENNRSKLQSLLETQNLQLKNQERAVSEKRKRLTQAKSRSGELRALINQIRALGQQFCETTPQATICPLCQAEYAKGVLLDRLNKTVSDLDDDPQLRQLTAELSELESAFKKARQLANDFNSLREAAELVLRKNQTESFSVEAIVQKLSAISDESLEEKEKFTKLTQTQKRLKVLGFTEEQLNELFDEAKESFNYPISTFENITSLRKAIDEHEKLQTRLADEIRELEKKQNETEAELQRTVKCSLGKVEVEDAPVELQRRLDLALETLTVARDGKLFSANVEEDFTLLANRLKAFGETVARLEEKLKRLEEKGVLEKRISSSLIDTRNKLTKSETGQTKAKDALKVLNKLLEVENKTAYLEKVVGQHREKLVTIFTRIHSPNDFKDVRLNGDIILRRHDGIDASVSKISTGQRSALALSIFLSLNSGVSERAPWLLFDDPVVHVDDLNTLSFFDALRDLTILGNRQVFFATANTRIANLFTRKFDFLGAEFRDFSLERSSENLAEANRKSGI